MVDSPWLDMNTEIQYPGASLLGKDCLRLEGSEVPLLSGEVHFFRMDPGVWEKCLDQVKAFGLPIVSTYLSWRRFSLGPGEYDLTGRTNPRLDLPRFLDLCRQKGLWVILKPGPWICAEEANGGYPDWLVSDPELQVLDAQGNTTTGYMGPFRSPIPSYLHPKYREAVRGWLKAVDEVIAGHLYPRGRVVMMQLDNEPCYTFHDGMFESDYNPVQVSIYPHWLEQKYQTVEALNRSHRSEYAAFAEVQPPRDLDGLAVEKLPALLDWAAFKEWTLARHVASIGEFHLENGVDSLLFTTNLNEHPQLAVPNHWQKLEKASGLAGFDYYPARMPMQPEEFVKVALGVNYSRSVLKAAWSPEIMTGIWTFEGQEHGPDHLKAEDYEFLYMTCIAFGLKGMNFYMLADRDNWVNSPVNERGERTATAAAVERVMALFRAAPQLRTLDRRQPVGVLYYRPYAREMFIVGGKPVKTDSGVFGESHALFYQLYEQLLFANSDPRVVDLEAAPEGLEGVHLLFVPSGPYMDRKTQEQLKAYAEAGGKLVFVSAPPGLDECMQPISLFAEGFERRPAGRGWIQAIDPERIQATASLVQELHLEPAVRPENHRVLAVCQQGGGVELLFVINPGAEVEQTALDFSNRKSGRLAGIAGRAENISILDGRARVSLPPRSVLAFAAESL